MYIIIYKRAIHRERDTCAAATLWELRRRAIYIFRTSVCTLLPELSCACAPIRRQVHIHIYIVSALRPPRPNFCNISNVSPDLK